MPPGLESEMTETPVASPGSDTGISGNVIAIAIVLGTLVVAAVFGVFYFIDDQRGRDQRAWQTRLAIIADSRAGAVNDWFENGIAGELSALAANESLQIYMTELALAGGVRDRVTGVRAQAAYLRNLLMVTAERAGFKGPVSGADVNANVRRIGVAGIALFDMKGNVLSATPGMPPLEGRLGTFFGTLKRGASATLDMHRGAGNVLVMGYATPVYTVQGDNLAGEQVGWVIGAKPVEKELFPLLVQPGEINKTAENILLRKSGPLIEYISPLRDGSAALGRSFAENTKGLAAARLFSKPGSFVMARDYGEKEVLAIGRPLAQLPWILVSKINRAEALGDSDRRLKQLLIGALLVLALVVTLCVALWRHGASRRASEAAARYAEIARQYALQEELLRLVTDSQPSAIYIVDEDGVYHFANEEAARLAGIEAENMEGKTLSSVLGPAEARHRMTRNAQVFETGEEVSGTITSADSPTDPDGGDVRIIQAVHIPLPTGEGQKPAVLVVESDMTEAVTERARRERILNQMVATLMRVVDARDPFSAHQSERTSFLAGAIAREMDLDPVLVQTAEIAGNLMNLGKILVPTEILTKTGDLTEDELHKVRESMAASADLIAGIEFDGPVVDTLNQLQEKWDGSGAPDGLAGEQIVMPARIVSVANAFVAMVSPRAYRAGNSIDESLTHILGQSGKAFDRRCVAALVSFMDNHGGRAQWDARLKESRAG